MTTVETSTGTTVDTAADTAAEVDRPRLRRPRLLAERPLHLLGLRPGWPLWALLALYPLWWALGLGTLIFLILAVPMAIDLSRRRPLRLPPGFWLWGLFLIWVVVSASTLGMNPPNTVVDSLGSRIPAYLLRLAQYVAATITLVYAGNLTEREMPQSKLVRLLGFMFLTTLAGGILGVLAPHFSFTSPTEALLPNSLVAHQYVHDLVHPTAAQVENILGYTSPRPSAPFTYTNAWGNVLSITLPWFLIWMGVASRGRPSRRLVGLALVAVAIVPTVYSVNRGLWIGLGVSLLYVVIRLALRGKLLPVGALAVALIAGIAIFPSTPLQRIVTDRLAHPHSNQGRTYQSIAAIKGATHSPIVGFGSTRGIVGGHQSITVGRSSACARCGNEAIGGAGQLWLLVFAQGFVGAFLYVGFFVRVLWRYRRDSTAIGIAGSLVTLLGLVYMFVYGSVGAPLTLSFLAIALMWRGERGRAARARAAAAGEDGPPRGARRRIPRSA